MIAIFKYPLAIASPQDITMPARNRVLSVGLDPSGDLCLWVAVDTNVVNSETKTVILFGTGHNLHDEKNLSQFVGSVTRHEFVWHVFVSNLGDLGQ